MPTHIQNFVPSPNELSLASRLLEMNTGSWNRSDYLSVDTAIGIFKQSGISFKQLREMWSIADKHGSGKLTKEELAIVIRLTGWIQAGEELNERLLEKAGPLPKIKGIPDAVAAKITHIFPPISPDDVAKLKEAFLRYRPVNGVLQKRTVMAAYMAAKPDLSFEALFRVIQLVDDKSGLFNFKNFAIGLHIVRSLENATISGVPSSIPLDKSKILDGAFGSGDGLLDTETSDLTTPTTIVEIPAQVDADLRDFMENIELTQHISGTMTLNFLSKYHINPAEMADIWRQSELECGFGLSPTRMALIEQLIRKRVAKQLSTSDSQVLPPVQQHSSQISAEQAPPSEEITQFSSGLNNLSTSPAAKANLSSTHPHDITHQQPPSYDSSTNPHDAILGRFKNEVERLTSQLGAVVIDQGWVNTELKTHFESLRQQNLQLKKQNQMLQHQLATKEETCCKAEKAIDSIKLDLLEQQVISKECQEATIVAKNEAERLWSTVETQSRQITTLLELVADMKTTIMELNLKPESTDLRLRFLRATVRESEATATKASGECLKLRQIVSARELEIASLRQRLEGSPNQQPVSETDKDLQSLRNDHEDLKVQMENMQRLLEHVMISRTQPGTVEDEDTLVQPRELDHGDKKKPDFNDLPPVISKSVKHQSLLTDSSCANIPDTKIYPFYLSPKSSTYSSLARSPHVVQEGAVCERDDTSKGALQLEDDLHLFRLHVQRKGYIGIEMVERFISKYDLDAYALDEIGRLVGLDASVKRINQAVDMIRQVLTSPRNHDHNSLSAILSRSSSSSSTSTSSNAAKSSDPLQGYTFKSSRNELQPSTRFYTPVRTSTLSYVQGFGSLPQSTISSVNPSMSSTINSSMQSTMAMCNGVV